MVVNESAIVNLILSTDIEVSPLVTDAPIPIPEITKQLTHLDRILNNQDPFPRKIGISIITNENPTGQTTGYVTRLVTVKAGQVDVSDQALNVKLLTNTKILIMSVFVQGGTVKLLLLIVGDIVAAEPNDLLLDVISKTVIPQVNQAETVQPYTGTVIEQAFVDLEHTTAAEFRAVHVVIHKA